MKKLNWFTWFLYRLGYKEQERTNTFLRNHLAKRYKELKKLNETNSQ